MVKQFPHIEIERLDYAYRGTNSAIAIENLWDCCSPEGSTPLNSNDIIFWDYSVNDSWLEMEESLGDLIENAIRTILHHFPPENRPTIIMLETFPFGSANRIRPAKIGDLADYTQAYSSVAKHYGLLKFSYADAMAAAVQADPSNPLMPYLRFREAHPPWFVHLFIAELYVNAFKYTVHKHCVVNKNTNTALPPPSIPAPLYGPDREYICMNFPPLLDERAKSYLAPVFSNRYLRFLSVVQHHNWSVITSPPSLTPLHGWKVVEERKSKIGWISIASSIEGFFSTLSFPLYYNLTYTPQRLILSVEYLLTYENAGIFTISLCGRDFEIDTLGWMYASMRRVEYLDLISFCLDLSGVVVNLTHKWVTGEEAYRLTQKVVVYKVKVC
jgi:hypothetical protein